MMHTFSLLLAFLVSGFPYIKPIPSTTRVVGGEDAYIGQFPHQVSLHRDGNYVCGGSILNKHFILTAAHCVVSKNTSRIEVYPPEIFQVRVGSIQRSMGGQLFNLTQIIANDFSNFMNDIALLELEEPLEWSDYVKPIEMATEEVPSDEDIIISGFGRLYKQGPIPHYLQWNTLKSLTTEECTQFTHLANDSLICLSHPVGNGACNGDSGGPAIYNDTLVGVANFVIGGCGSSNPDGYANVSYHYNWILENMNLDEEVIAFEDIVLY